METRERERESVRKREEKYERESQSVRGREREGKR